MKIWHNPSPANLPKFLFKHNAEQSEQKESHESVRTNERTTVHQTAKTQRYLLELDATIQVKSGQETPSHKNSAKKYLGLHGKEGNGQNKAEKLHGIGLQKSRREAVEKQFDLAKSSLDQRQRQLEKLYLGDKGQQAFFEVFEKHMGRMFDTRTGLVGGVGWLLGRVGLSYNRSLEKKMEKKLGIKPENFRKLYQEMQTGLEKNKIQFEQIEAAEAKKSQKSVKEFRRSGEYKTFLSDIATVGLSLGLNALGLTTGVSVPLMYVSPKRKALAMDTDAILKYMGEGMTYTEAITLASEETDQSVFMAHNLMRNANVLIAGPTGKNSAGETLSNIEDRWAGFCALRSNLSFDKNKYNQGNIEEKNLYESLGFVVDSQGLVHLKEAKKLRSVFFRFGERLITDRKENKYYKQALKTLKKTPKKGKLSEREIVQLNQEKVEALDIILERMKQENAEDFLRRSSRKDAQKVENFNEQQLTAGKFESKDLKKKYQKRPDKMEGRVAALRQMERFLDSQKILVKNQREFHAIRSLTSKKSAENSKKSDILYQGAVLSFLSSFDNAQGVIGNFPILFERNYQDKIRSLLLHYYESKSSKAVTENQALQTLIADDDFRDWIECVGRWSKEQANNECYQRMNCVEKLSYDRRRISAQADKNQTKYKFNSVAAIAPRGQGGGIPLTVSTSWIDPNWLDIGQARTRDITTSSTTTQLQEQIIKDPFGNDIIIEVPMDVITNTVTTQNIPLTTSERLIGEFGAAAGSLFFANVVPGVGNTPSEKRVKKDAKERYEGLKKKTKARRKAD